MLEYWYIALDLYYTSCDSLSSGNENKKVTERQGAPCAQLFLFCFNFFRLSFRLALLFRRCFVFSLLDNRLSFPSQLEVVILGRLLY